MADDSFEVRVKRLFGSNLFTTVPENSFPSSSWSVAGGEVERRQWNRERGAGPDRSDDPCASAFDDKYSCFNDKNRSSSSGGGAAAGNHKKDFEKDLNDLDDDEGEAKEIRSFIGLDPTLDREEEEDEYDRAAFHKEKAEDRVYMREINDVGPYISCRTVLEDLEDDTVEEIHSQQRDPRADHFAASLRLKKDLPPVPNLSFEETDMKQRNVTNSKANLKPILRKREEDQHDSKIRKRVRFDATFKEEQEEVGLEVPQNSNLIPQSKNSNVTTQVDVPKPEESRNVPDYIRNPSKYTCYILDSSDNDDEANNKRAFEDFQKLVRKSKPQQVLLDAGVELPKSVAFTPRRKAGDPMSMDDKVGEDNQVSGLAMGLAAGEMDDNDADEMEEVSPTETRISSRKEVRQYRLKSSSANAT